MFSKSRKQTLLKYIKSVKDDRDLIGKSLGKLCENYPKHTEKEEIKAKVFIIARTLAVQLERVHPKLKKGVDIYDEVAKAFLKNKKADSIFSKIRGDKKSTVQFHYKEFHDVVAKSYPKSVANKHHPSFCSKYLHYHFPQIFPLMDQRAEKGLRKLFVLLGKKRQPNITWLTKHEEYGNVFSDGKKIISRYALFCCRFDIAKKELINKFPQHEKIISNLKKFDELLLEIEKG